MIRWNLIHWVILALLICACRRDGPADNSDAKKPAVESAAAIQNDDVKWDGTYTGLVPSLFGASKALRRRTNEQTMALLIDALADKNRYIAAHVLLTELSGKRYQTGPNSWNDLHVSLASDGSVRIPEGEQAFLIRKWSEWYKHSLALNPDRPAQPGSGD